MTRTTLAAIVIAGFVSGAPGPGTLAAADRPALAGRWTLNRNLSQFPRDIGFGMDLVTGPGSGSAGGGISGGGGSDLAAVASMRESEDDARRREMLVGEVSDPSPHLTIAQTDAAITITDERGRARTFHPDGREESQTIGQVPVTTVTRWEGTRLEVRYKVEQNRELRYTYSRTLDPPQLVVQVHFVERGDKDTVTRIYEPARPNEVMTRQEATPPAQPGAPANAAPPAQTPPTTWTPPQGAPPALPPPAGAARASDLGNPASQNQAPPGRATSPIVARGPDAELKGITKLGVVVEDLGPQAATCGLRRDPIEAAATKSLSDAGLTVRRNSDEDTYVYVNINTTSAPGGLCVSRYDVYLYTYTTATLSYQSTPALVQVTLLHKGGHAESVMQNVKQYVDEFASRVRAVNR